VRERVSRAVLRSPAVAASEYDPAFGSSLDRRDAEEEGGLDEVRRIFRRASRPYLSSPWPWVGWALVLPAAALATGRAAAAFGAPGVLVLWCSAILVGGAVEGVTLLGARRRFGASRAGAWAMRIQGNLSLVATALSAALVWAGRPQLLPALWLLLLGHSLFVLGGLALPAQRTAGIVYQLGGVAALIPGVPALPVFAAATCLGNLWIATGILRARRHAE
jgi:hypothetical protein